RTSVYDIFTRIEFRRVLFRSIAIHPRLGGHGTDALDQLAVAVGEAEARACDGVIYTNGLFGLQIHQFQGVAVVGYTALVELEREAVVRLRSSANTQFELVDLAWSRRVGQP